MLSTLTAFKFYPAPCMHTHTYTYARTHTHTHVHTHIYIYLYIYNIYVHTHIYISISISISMYIPPIPAPNTNIRPTFRNMNGSIHFQQWVNGKKLLGQLYRLWKGQYKSLHPNGCHTSGPFIMAHDWSLCTLQISLLTIQPIARLNVTGHISGLGL